MALDSVTQALVCAIVGPGAGPPSAVIPKDSRLRCFVEDPTKGLEFGVNVLTPWIIELRIALAPAVDERLPRLIRAP